MLPSEFSFLLLSLSSPSFSCSDSCPPGIDFLRGFHFRAQNELLKEEEKRFLALIPLVDKNFLKKLSFRKANMDSNAVFDFALGW